MKFLVVIATIIASVNAIDFLPYQVSDISMGYLDGLVNSHLKDEGAQCYALYISLHRQLNDIYNNVDKIISFTDFGDKTDEIKKVI